VIEESVHEEKDKEFDWRDRLKQWKNVQQSGGAVLNFTQKGQETFRSTSISVLGCLQATFSDKDLQDQIERSLMIGLQRSAGLDLLKYVTKLNGHKDQFYDALE
jgi:hypothetical protein